MGVLRLPVKGFTNQEIVRFLDISGRTVAAHLHNIYQKIGAVNRAEATAYTIQYGLV